MFSCQISLTKDGLKNYKEVVKVLFQYIALLKDAPPQRWIFDEQKSLADADFKFQQKTTASSFTRKISAVMQKPLPREWLLSGYSRLRKFDEESISAGLNCLRADNFRMQISSQTFPGGWDSKEKWYGTEYKYEKIPADFLDEIKKAATSKKGERFPELHLPCANQFIPTKLEVEKKEVKTPATSPKVIRNDDLVRLWYKKGQKFPFSCKNLIANSFLDDTFWVPKANVIIKCRSPVSTATAENYVKADLYTRLVSDVLKEDADVAQLTVVKYSVSVRPMGLEISVSGYNDELPIILEKILTAMRNHQIKEDRFHIIKEEMKCHMKNLDFEDPCNQAGD